MTITETIKAAREAAGLTQTDVAGEAGISQAYLSQLEAGKKDPFTKPDELLRRLADAIGTTVRKLRS